MSQDHVWMSDQMAEPNAPGTMAPMGGLAMRAIGEPTLDVSSSTTDDGNIAACAGFVSRPETVYGPFHGTSLTIPGVGIVKAQVPDTGSSITVTRVVAVYGPGSV